MRNGALPWNDIERGDAGEGEQPWGSGVVHSLVISWRMGPLPIRAKAC